MIFNVLSTSFPCGAFVPHASVGGIATIDYYYTQASAVPEPSALVLVVSGLIGLGVVRKKLV